MEAKYKLIAMEAYINQEIKNLHSTLDYYDKIESETEYKAVAGALERLREIERIKNYLNELNETK